MSENKNSPPSILLLDENLQDRSLTSFMTLSAVPDVGLKEISEESEFLSAIRGSSYALVITESRASWAPFELLLTEIRRHQPQAQVVVFTSDASAEVREVAEREGAADCVAKSSEGFLSLVGIVKEALLAPPLEAHPPADPEPPVEAPSEPGTSFEAAGVEAPSEPGTSFEAAGVEAPSEPDASVELPVEAQSERETSIEAADSEASATSTADEEDPPVDGDAAADVPTEREVAVEPPSEGEEVPPRSGLPSWVRGSLIALAVVVVVALFFLVRGADEPEPKAEPSIGRSATEPAAAVGTEPAPVANEVAELDADTPELVLEDDSQGEVVPAQEAPLTLVLRAEEQVWVAVSVDGEQVLDATLEAGEERSFAGQESASLRVGNAAGLRVSWNGEDLGSIGRPRQVRQLGFSTSEYWFGRRRTEPGS